MVIWKKPWVIENNKKRKGARYPGVSESNRKRKGEKRPPRPDLVEYNRTVKSIQMKENNPSKRPEVRDKQRRADDRHHIYLNDGPTMILSKGRHRRIHQKAYEYILENFGKEGIDKYTDWFLKKY